MPNPDSKLGELKLMIHTEYLKCYPPTQQKEQMMYAKWHRKKKLLMEHTVCYPQGPPLFLVIKALVGLSETQTYSHKAWH